MLPAVSVTEVRWLVAPVYSLTDRTSRLPDDVAEGKDPLRAVDDAVSVAPAIWTRWGTVVVTGVTVSEKVVEWVIDEPVPATVMVEVAIGVDDDVVMVMVEL